MKDFEDAMLDISWNNKESMVKRYNSADTKAIGVISICGVFISFMVSFVFNKSIDLFIRVIFLLTSVSFILSVMFCISAIRPRDSVEDISTELLIEDLRDKKPEHQIRGLIATIGGVENSWKNICVHKAHDLRMAVYALGCCVLLLSVAFFSLVLL